MIEAAVYERVTGRIRRTLTANDLTLGQTPMAEDEALTVGASDPDLHYVFQGRLMHRPSLPDVETDGQVLTFASALPEGATLHVVSNFIDAEFVAETQVIALAVPEEAQIAIIAPWPYQEQHVGLDGAGSEIPDNAQIITPDLDRMKAYFEAALYQQADALTASLLGDPDENTQRRWLIKRELYGKFEAGNLSAADRAALGEEVRYSGQSVDDHLAGIGAKVSFQNWVTLRSDGLRGEAEARLDAAVAPQDVLDVITWAEGETSNAVLEAQSILAG